MARGGMGELFLSAAGEVGGFEKMCVVKKVLADLNEPTVHRRFLDEAKVVVRLNHSNLVQVFDAGRVGHEYYLTMELVEGKDLRAIWNRCAQKKRRIPVEFAIFVMRDVCRGLHYVHDSVGLDLVHRDISPPNILVSYHGQVKITDFGLAKHAIKRELTMPGVVYGRYSYLAPEQARGESADRRSDIYAAAIVLWEMLTGRQMFPVDQHLLEGKTLEMLRNPRFIAPSSLVPGIPDGLDRVLRRALAPERNDRFPTANEFRGALAEVLTRHYPSYDIDRASEFMREIFDHEYQTELQDYASYAREDFSSVRNQRPRAETFSIEAGDIDKAFEELDSAGSSQSASGTISTAAGPPRRVKKGTSAQLQLAAEERIRKTISGRYRLDRLLGIGGMGAVYVATHLRLDKCYAIKILHARFSQDREIAARFQREAQVATQTGHPNIIDVVDIGTTNQGESYLVMELLEGTDLAQIISSGGPMNIRRAVHIARQVCRALAEAHRAGVVHRDLKPENIMIIHQERDPDFVKVLDFGICKQVDNTQAADTSPGMVIGSPDYMAPEQAAGAKSVDPKADIYALGTVMFEMLTGRRPFVGRSSLDVLVKKGRDDAPDVQSLRPDVPAALALVVKRCLSRDPAQRPPKMRAVEYELARAVDGRIRAVTSMIGIDKPETGIDRGFDDPENLEDTVPFNRDGDPNEDIPGFEIERENLESEEVAAKAQAGEAANLGQANLGQEMPLDAGSFELDESWRAGASWRSIAMACSGAVALSLGVWVLIQDKGEAPLQDAAAVAQIIDESDVKTPERLDASDEEAPLLVDPEDEGEEAPAKAEKVIEAKEERPAAVPQVPSTPQGEGVPFAPNTPNPTPGDKAAESADKEAKALAKEAPLAANNDNSVEAIVSRAELAFEQKHWSTPLRGSLVMELTSLSLVDPSHEAIGRLRSGASALLLPLASEAYSQRKWRLAVQRYRELNALVPHHGGFSERLAQALIAQARVALSKEDLELADRSTAELVNRRPRSVELRLLRARTLGKKDDWKGAIREYRAAVRIAPKSERAMRGIQRAEQRLQAAAKGQP